MQRVVPIRRGKRRQFILAMATVGCCAPAALSAVDYVWQANNSGNLSGSWNTASNWSPSGPATGQNNIADFSQQDITANSTVTLDANQTIGGLIFGDTTTSSAGDWFITPGSGNYTLTLSVSSGSPTITVNALGSGSYAEITAALTGTQGFNKNGSGELILGSGASDTVAETYSGTIYVTAGTLLLNKADGTDAITGNVTINGGTLELNRSDQIDNSSTLSLSSGAFEGNGYNETVASVFISGGNFQTIAGTNVVSNVITVTGATTLSGGTLTLNSTGSGSGTTFSTNSFLMTGGTTVFGSASGGIQKLIVGSGGITLSNAVTMAIGAGASGLGGGDLVLNGNLSSIAILSGTGGQSITGPTSATTASVGGVIDLNGGTRTFYVENGTPATDLDISAVIGTNGAYKSTTVGSTTGNLTKTGSGTLQLDPYFQDNFGGTLSVNEGTLTLAFTHLATPTDLIANGSSPNTSPLTLGGGTLNILGDPASGVATSQSFGGTFTINPGLGGILLTPNGGGGVTLNLPSSWSRSTGGTLLVNLAAGSGVVASNPATDSTGILSYAIVEDATGIGFATVSSGDIVRYSGATVLTGSSNTGLSSGTNYYLNLPSGTTSSTLTGSANSLQITAAANSTISFSSGTFTLASGGLLVSGAATQNTLSSGTLASSNNNEVIIHEDQSSGGILFLSTSLTFPTSASLTLDGTSLSTVAFQNNTLTFTGGVQLNTGVVAAVTASTISSGGTLQSGPMGTGTITFAGGEIRSTTNANTEIDNPTNLDADLTIPSPGGDKILTLGGPMTLVGGNHTIFQNSAAAVVISGIISDGGNGYQLVKSGSGILTVSAANAFGGGMRVDSGRLLVDNTIGSGTGSGPVTVRGGTLAGTGNISGATTVNSGAIISAGDGVSTPGELTLSAPSGNLLSDGSKYDWKINDAVGAMGSSDGWDDLVFSSLSAGTASGVDVVPLAVGTGSTVKNFQTGQPYQWAIANVPGNGAALLASFHLDTTALSTFASELGASPSNFSLSADPNDIYFNYTPAPEPTSLMFAGAGAAVLLRRRRGSNAGRASIT